MTHPLIDWSTSPLASLLLPIFPGRYGVYGQGHPHRYGVYGQEHKHHGYGAYGHHRRLASIEAGATRELQGVMHGHKHHGGELAFCSLSVSLAWVDLLSAGRVCWDKRLAAQRPHLLLTFLLPSNFTLSPAGRYGVYGQGHPHRYGVYGQEHKHRGYGAYGHHRRLSSFESGAARELQGFASHAHGHKHHGAELGVLGRQHSIGTRGLGAGWLSTLSCC